MPDPGSPSAQDPHAELMAELNRHCHCIGLDADRLAEWIDREQPNLRALMQERQPHTFASVPVFVPREHVRAMERIVAAVHEVAALPSYQQEVLRWAPPIASVPCGPQGVFFGYDFHLTPTGPQLIEVNTNAGGAVLNLALASAQRACCVEVEPYVNGPYPRADLERQWVTMFRAEWERFDTGRPLLRIAIVDDQPGDQFLYPEFLLLQRTLNESGITTVIADASELWLEDEWLHHPTGPVDLVYNRLTDFYLADHPVLAAAYANRLAAVTPHPRAHALYAHKRNLTLLSNPGLLAELGASADAIATLHTGVPTTIAVAPDNAEQLWNERDRYFFKPMTGFGSRAAWRGDKITRKNWSTVLANDYVAQRLVAPSERTVLCDGQPVSLKLDVRCYVYDGRVQLLGARLYRGQTTNLRTPGGGFAPVYTQPLR